MSVGDDLQLALTALREKGWCRYEAQLPSGEMCARGALWHALGWGTDMRIEAADAALARHIPADFQGDDSVQGRHRDRVPQYNNTRQNFAEVEEWFEKAIADEGITL